MQLCRWPCCLGLVLAALAPSWAWAHALGAECTLRGQRVDIEAYYDDDTPARAAHIKVLDDQGQAIVQGTTNDQGRYSCPRPQPGTYQVIIDAGAGHRLQIKMTVPAQDSGQAKSSSPPSAATQISAGPNRSDFTGFHWLGVVMGLGCIVGAGFLGRFWLRHRPRQQTVDHPG